ncbi:MAG: orotate phosphoribosyltransferase [Candidatus Thermoplasmatota archaeon]|nr:orotate phosphoribosyltransferase [Candidatus Thermoplasmatota archaeon]|tara:strand:- start:517 stop:1119 length:603 start_codon:yes stop_codon:yes gene_type:complete
MNLQDKIRNHPKWIELVEQVKKLSYLKGEENEFTLASGRTSSHFFDMKPLMMDPLGSLLLAELMEVYLDELEPEFVGGLELGAVPLTAIAITGNAKSSKGSKRKGFMVRKEPKGRGGRKTSNPPGIEGSSLSNGGNIVILEDVTTTGGSAIKAVKMISSTTDCNVVGVLAILDREEGGKEAFLKAGIPFESLLTLSDITG